MAGFGAKGAPGAAGAKGALGAAGVGDAMDTAVGLPPRWRRRPQRPRGRGGGDGRAATRDGWGGAAGDLGRTGS